MKIKNFNGNYIEVESTRLEDLNVLDTGYIVSPEGACIKIYEDQDHNTIFSEYINRYLEN